MKSFTISIVVVIVIYSELVTPRQVWKLTAIKEDPALNFSKSTTVASISECAERCTKDCGCVSFRFDTVNLYCYFYEKMIYAEHSSITSPNQAYYWPLIELADCGSHTGYVANMDKKICYKVFTWHVAWGNALLKCGENRGHLLIADTDWKIELARALLPNYSIHLGARGRKQNFKWNDGRLVSSESFTNSQYQQDTTCMFLGSGSNLTAGSCTQFRPFICEIPCVHK